MQLRDILLLVGSGVPASVPRAAAQLARRHDAHVTGLFVAPPVAPVAGQGGELIQDALRQRRAEAVDEVKTVFEACIAEAGIQARSEWRSEIGEPAIGARRSARRADLAVVCQAPQDGYIQMNGPRPEDLLFGSGRPVLVIPRFGEYPSIGERVLVAWDGSAEAARAVNDAFPFLAAARKVTILVVNPDAEAVGALPGADIARHLARHGIEVTVSRTESRELAISDVLLNFSADEGADLLVMGGYGHSRLREMAFGGVTRDILKTTTLPVLMAH
ncbi:universal stress protein [Arenibaculum pallidiluteum]|uniref:universal stress protein n=1 Tax=Arenibaculum pallidiluteum TaxID=2812559 RepID=UPI001A9686EC|nr:universal stress protein [Arenibaculum pallidiluteum]